MVVFKVGGSLLDLPQLPILLARVLSQRPGQDPLLVVGGAAIADSVRDWDRIHGLGEERAHWLALKSLEVTESLIAQLLEHVQFVSSHAEFMGARSDRALPVLSAHAFLKADECASSAHLPHTWAVTSDSIAAWIAWRWQADELVLIKSAPLPKAKSLAEAQQAGLVDQYFPRIAVNLPRVSWANLRTPSPLIEDWHSKAQSI